MIRVEPNRVEPIRRPTGIPHIDRTQMPPPAEGFVARLLLGPALRTQPDGRLVSLVREGYEAAFEEIVRRYRVPLRRYAAAIVGASADDVTQDALSKAFLALRRDDKEIELRPWLYRILRNTALNDLRDRPPQSSELHERIEGRPGVAEEVERREEIEDLLGRLRALPEPQRAAIVMRELEGLGHAEIATALGISGGAARQAIHRARTALRDGLGMAIPLPLLKLMLDGSGAPTAEIAAGGAGAGVVLKAATATVLVAGTLGAGLALHHNAHGGSKPINGAPAGKAQGPGRLATSPDGTARIARKDAPDTHGGNPTYRGQGDRRSSSHDPSEGGRSGPGRGHGGDGSGGGHDPGSGSDVSVDGGQSDGGSSDGSQSDGGISLSESGSGSNSGPDSGAEDGSLSTESGGSGDSGGSDGFSGQMEAQTTEEDR